MLSKINIIIITSIFLFFAQSSANNISTSVSLFNDYLWTKIHNQKVLSETENLIKYNYGKFIHNFILKYNKTFSSFYSPLTMSEAVIPSAFYKAYDAYIKLSNSENPYLTKDSLINKEHKVIEWYKEGKYKKYLNNVDYNLINEIKNDKLYDGSTPSIDPITLIRYNTNYDKEINNNRISSYIPTNVEKEWKDYLKNIMWIKNNKCSNYKICAEKAFIWNNANNIPSDKMKNVDMNILFNNNIRALSLEQSNIFIKDFITSKYLTFVYDKNNYSTSNQVLINNKRSINYRQNQNSWKTTYITLKNNLLNLRLMYSNVLSIIDRYYTSPRQVLRTLLWCSINDSKSQEECAMIKDSDWGKTPTLLVKKWKKKTTLLAFVSTLDLPSVYLWKLNWIYYPTKYEKDVYNNWIFDNIYTNNGVFSEDLSNLLWDAITAKNLKNGFSAIQWKWLENSRKLYQNKWNLKDILEKSTMVTVNWTIIDSSDFNLKWFSINFFPTLTSLWFKIELNNNSYVIKNIINNNNSEYNKIVKEIEALYVQWYNLWMRATYLKGNILLLLWGDSYLGDLYNSEKRKSWDAIDLVPKGFKSSFNDKNLFNQTINNYNKIKRIHNTVKNIIINLNKNTISLYKIFLSNPTTNNYMNFTNKYAEQLIYSSLYNSVKKLYYPIKFVYNNKLFYGFWTLNGWRSNHVNFISSIVYNIHTKKPFVIRMINSYRKVLKKLEWYHYTRKKDQMIKDYLNNVNISWLVDSYNVSPTNKAEAKLQTIMENAINLPNIRSSVRQIQRKYSKLNHSVYTEIDYSKFTRFKNASDKFYNKSEILTKLDNILRRNHIWSIKTYYPMGEITDLRWDLKNVYDLSNNYITMIK